MVLFIAALCTSECSFAMRDQSFGISVVLEMFFFAWGRDIPGIDSLEGHNFDYFPILSYGGAVQFVVLNI